MTFCSFLQYLAALHFIHERQLFLIVLLEFRVTFTFSKHCQDLIDTIALFNKCFVIFVIELTLFKEVNEDQELLFTDLSTIILSDEYAHVVIGA